MIYGRVPGWALMLSGSGDGFGDGFGYGDGDSSGDGYGDSSGSGSGFGDGYGSGDGFGDGYGFGFGYGDGLERSVPVPVTVRVGHLKGACGDQVALFRRTFPNGAEWPTDIQKAIDAGLNVEWVKSIGLLPPITERLTNEEGGNA